MKLTNEQITKLIEIAKKGDNFKEDNYFSDYDKDLPRMMIHGKVLVDRWYNVTEKFIFNTQNKKMVDKCLKLWSDGKTTGYTGYDGKHIWGADVEYSDVVPHDRILCLSNLDQIDTIINIVVDTENDLDDPLKNGRPVAIIPMPQKQ